MEVVAGDFPVVVGRQTLLDLVGRRHSFALRLVVVPAEIGIRTETWRRSVCGSVRTLMVEGLCRSAMEPHIDLAGNPQQVRRFKSGPTTTMTKRPCRWIAHGMMSLMLSWTSGCAYVDEIGGNPPGNWYPPGSPGGPPHGPTPGPSPGPPQSGSGYVGTDRRSWRVWHDVMPGPGPATLHIEGVVTVSAANYNAFLRRRSSPPDVLHYDVLITRTGDFGAQVLTRRQVSLAVPYGGNHDSLTLHFPNGERIPLRIMRAY